MELDVSAPVQACYKDSENWSFTMLINLVTDEQDKFNCELSVSLQENRCLFFVATDEEKN